MAGMTGLIDGDADKARRLLEETGDDGTPVVLLHATDVNALKSLAPVAKSAPERARFRVDMQAMDWQTFVTRVAKKVAPTDGGRNAFATSWQQIDVLDPLTTTFLAAVCDKARPGWPCDQEMEQLRDRFAHASEPKRKRAIAEEVQILNTKIVTHVPIGEWFNASAARDNIEMLSSAPFLVFWELDKK
jgi:peptide/nickel transport system substrate-binding protein